MCKSIALLLLLSACAAQSDASNGAAGDSSSRGGGTSDTGGAATGGAAAGGAASGGTATGGADSGRNDASTVGRDGGAGGSGNIAGAGGGGAGSQAAETSVTVSPQVATVAVNKTLQLTANITGAASASVTWSVTGQGCGTVSSSGLYTAPAAVPSTAQCQVTATSATIGKSGTATLTISVGSSGQPGVWEDVNPAGLILDPTAFGGNNFGVQDVLTDPVRRSDMYAFTCYQGVYRSTDYGMTWKKVSQQGSILEKGRQWGAAIDPNLSRNPVEAPAMYTMNGYGTAGFFRSTDFGVTWDEIGSKDGFYNVEIDPYDNQHMIAGFHEQTGITQSTDGGVTWKDIVTPGTGNSIYPFFIDTGNATTTGTTWLMLSQDYSGGNPYRTTDSGAHWTQVGTFGHPHGAAQIFQGGGGFVYAGSCPGVFQSADYGVSWKAVSSKCEAVVAGTPTTLYTSSSINFSSGPPNVQTAPRSSGTQWSDMSLPANLKHGAKRLAVTYDGTHHVLVAGSWMSGIWRYVEP
jgi:hypothetical protein